MENLKLDFLSGIPIYKQIVTRFASLIASGEWKKGDRLPSVRTLTIQLNVNPNTIVKAYRELELSGLVYMSRGVGCFVADKPQIDRSLDDEKKQTILSGLFGTFRDQVLQLGVTEQDLKVFLTNMILEEKKK